MLPIVEQRSLCQVILAPSLQPAKPGNKKVFLAGTTTKAKKEPFSWRDPVIEALRDFPVTIFNPFRPDWDSTWREELTCDLFVEQTNWELDRQQDADITVVYFQPGTDAPISLLELGLRAGSGRKAIVGCPEGYSKRGNVQIVCRRFGIICVPTLQELIREVEQALRE